MSLLPKLSSADFSPLLGGADYGEAFLERSRGLSLRFEDGRVEDVGSSSDHGLGLRYLKRRDGEIVTLQGSCQGLDAAAARRLRGGLFGDAPPAAAVAFRPLSLRRRPARIEPSSIPLDAKIGLLQSIDRAIRSEFPHIRQVTLSYGERERDVAILNS
ncbi:MAG: hypothetical protein KGK30_02780 [Elusimicrobia bacterium]|nr:hypothetical protein [Elusimicrobiota bacterium]